MEEMIKLSTQLHLAFIVLLIGLIGGNIYLLKKESSFGHLSKRLELLAPQYFIVLFAIFFTGLIIMAVRQFNVSWVVWVMSMVWALLVGFGIRGHKMYKHVKRFEIQPTSYKALALRKYFIDIILVGITLIVYYGVY